MSRRARTRVAVALVGVAMVWRPDMLAASRSQLAAAAPDVEVADLVTADLAIPPATTPTTVAVTTTTAPPAVRWFQPSGRNAGTEGLAKGLAELALKDNAPLYVSDTWGRTSGSGLSDHHVSQTGSWAVDLAVRGIQAPTPATEEAARRIGAALGVAGWTGGDLTTTIDGYRFQVLWKVAGHFNHVHVGIRRM